MSAVGGHGYLSAGGGAGGRIAIHTKDANEYKGEQLAYGSEGTSSGDMGGPGTVFVEDRMTAFTYQSRLYIYGLDLQPPKPIVINEKNPRHTVASSQTSNNADLDFEHLLLENSVSNSSYVFGSLAK